MRRTFFMKQLKNYTNLCQLYDQSIKKIKLPFLICLVIFILAFATFVISYFPFGLTLAMLAMIFPAILFGVLWLIASQRTQKQLKSLTGQQLDIIDSEILSCQMCDGVLVTSQAIVGTQLGLQFMPIENILWVYPSVTTATLVTIPLHKSTVLIVAGRNHKQQAFRIKNNQKAYGFVQSELLKYRLDLVFGYERGMDEIYKKDIDRLIAFSQECADKRRKEMEIQS